MLKLNFLAAASLMIVSATSSAKADLRNLEISFQKNDAGNFVGQIVNIGSRTALIRDVVINGREDEKACILNASLREEGSSYLVTLTRGDSSYWDDNPVPTHTLRRGDILNFVSWRGCGRILDMTVRSETEQVKYSFD